MGTKISLQPTVISVACGNGVVRVQYTVQLETDAYTGPIGNGETDITDEEINEAVEGLTCLVRAKLESVVGLGSGAKNPLSDDPAVGFEVDVDKEDPL